MRDLITRIFLKGGSVPRSEPLRMTVSDFLAWLHVADLEELSDEDLRQRLNAVLDSAPEESDRISEKLLDELEDQLESNTIDRETVLEWPNVYQSLLPEPLEQLEEAEERLHSRVDEVEDDALESPRLRRFELLLQTLGASGLEESVLTQAWEDLETLEMEIGNAWDEYRAEPFEADAVSAESVAGHRFLEDGFNSWFEAFELARVGEPQDALAAASEGNRLFRAVAEWSEDLAG